MLPSTTVKSASEWLMSGGRMSMPTLFAGWKREVAAFVDVFDGFGLVDHFEGEQGGHVLGGEVGFQPGGLIGDDGVAGGVGFVEAVAGEFFDEGEELGGLFLGDAVGLCAFDEGGFFLVDDFGGFFADGLDDVVGAAERNVADAVEDAHDLFLVDHDAVGFGEDFVDDGGDGRDGLAAVFAGAVIGDEVHRAGAIEGVGGDEIFEAVGLHLDEEVFHAAGFKLEDALGGAFLEDGFEDEGIGGVDFFNVDAAGEQRGIHCVAIPECFFTGICCQGISRPFGAVSLPGCMSFWMRSRARSRMVRVRRPRKSILRRPIFSQVGPSHWVMMSSPFL